MSDWQLTEGTPEIPPRDAEGHKGTFGRVLIIGGSQGMSGAVALAGLGALRGGAGLVYLAVPESIVSTVAAIEPSYLTIPIPEHTAGSEHWDEETVPQIINACDGKDAVAIGPGLSQAPGVKPLVDAVVSQLSVPVVIDADGLNSLATDLSSLVSANGPRILTPHPGEFARLTGKSIAEIQQSREDSAFQFAKEHRVIVVLKGPGTVVTDGKKLAINETGNSGMGTGGTGDVLTGLLTALLAQGMPPFDAARLAVHLHGLAGDLAAEELSQPGMIASDLAWYLTQAWREMQDE
ncbi:NAD(P)H-hydrate dehydratase [Calycomorphotria hydatis]|uniref:ADP-dependent (S)-NAD(P)H-hydrate dehydratase n=1 Tax=Calycomorphotria hydatis TaxID=2528027 RepID=A0A517TEN1_9PLAN|nr:NAD(P)H-hydrate dehydratase [Calycomorphotria hydatis]QDT66826.1 ATP-dependent (S)-NAD(P)H-hydrate dehydratase [Calycomorphotria hydatis]